VISGPGHGERLRERTEMPLVHPKKPGHRFVTALLWCKRRRFRFLPSTLREIQNRQYWRTHRPDRSNARSGRMRGKTTWRKGIIASFRRGQPAIFASLVMNPARRARQHPSSH